MASVREQRRGQIPVAGVRQEDDDGLTLVFRPLGQLNGRPCRRAGGNAYQHALPLADQLAGGEGILTTIYGILVFLPWWAVQFRRLHDTDRSAWWALLFLIPFIGWLIIIVFNCQAGTPGENRFGPDPKLEP